jgi:hypothetical protein
MWLEYNTRLSAGQEEKARRYEQFRRCCDALHRFGATSQLTMVPMAAAWSLSLAVDKAKAARALRYPFCLGQGACRALSVIEDHQACGP